MSLRRFALAAIVMAGALGQLVNGHSFATFTSAGAASPNQFSAGTVNLSASPVATLMSFSNLVPGDAVTAPLTIQNDGTLNVSYLAASTVTDSDGKGLGAQLTLAIRSGVLSCTAGGFSASGTTIYSGPLGAIGTSLSLIGDPSTLTGRALAAGGGETLCFQVGFPASSASSFSNATTTATFAFTAVQASGT